MAESPMATTATGTTTTTTMSAKSSQSSFRINTHLQACVAVLVVLTFLAIYRGGTQGILNIDLYATRSDIPTLYKGNGNVVECIRGDSSTQQERTAKGKVKTEPKTAADVPLNIMLFYADDWTMKVMGKLNPHVHTPNIDRMADEGVLFTNNCVTTSMCWISRATMVTGTYASRHLQLEPGDEAVFRTHPWNETVFPLLKSNGYHTGLVGKWHAPQLSPEMDMAFDYTNLYFGSHWEERNGELRHVTDLNLEDSLEFLTKRPKDKPFALKTAFFATHARDGYDPPYNPKNETKARYYNNVTIPVPVTNQETFWKRMPYFFNEGNDGRNRYRNRFDPPNYQNSIKDLYRMATEVDYAVGKIIQKLKSQGVYKQTLLIFTTDNGNMHGEHGLAEKWYAYEESIQVPLVIVDPRMPDSQRGTVNKEFTLSVDLAPTMLAAAKIPIPGFMQGRDMSDLYLESRNNNNPVRWRQDFFYEYNRGNPYTADGHEGKFWIDASFALVTKEWKYIYWPQHQYEQIFHRHCDPYETTDLVNNSQIVPTDDIYVKLRTRYDILKLWVQSGNPI
jgi:arylsulfatase